MKSILMVLISMVALQMSAQKYFTRNGEIYFLSDASLEKIEATNSNASSVIDASTGKLEWSVLIKGFQFEKALMQEHFNENYMESDKYPKAVFKGTITNLSAVNFTKDGNYTAKVKGDLTLHGVTKPYETTATITVKGGQVSAKSQFNITVADHQIDIPSVVKDKVAKVVKVTVSAKYELLKS